MALLVNIVIHHSSVYTLHSLDRGFTLRVTMYQTKKNPMNECRAACFILWAATQLGHTLRQLTSAQYMPSTFLTFGHTWKYTKQAALTPVGGHCLAEGLRALPPHTAKSSVRRQGGKQLRRYVAFRGSDRPP
jgi:hypothetical protein